MGKPGPKPRPVELKILAGERRDRMPRPGGGPAGRAPAMPDYLDDRGAEAWHRIVPGLESAGVLAEGDGEALALYCMAYSRWRMALREIAAAGVTATTDLGSLKPNPAVAVAVQAERMMAALLAEFGLTPSSRGRAGCDGGQSRDALAEFLANR